MSSDVAGGRAAAVERTAVLVLGMHRSGTSSVTGALQQLGVALGEPLMVSDDDQNSRGFFENIRLYDFHRSINRSLGRTWDDPRPFPTAWFESREADRAADRLSELLDDLFSQQRLWGAKDPRMCLLAPLWRRALERLGTRPAFILVGRPLAEVAGSLASRDAFSAEKSAGLWLLHTLEAERGSRGADRVTLGYRELLDDPIAVLAGVDRQLGLGLDRALEERRDAVREFVSPAMRRQRGTDAPKSYGRFAEPVHALGNRLDAGFEDGPETRAMLDSVREQAAGIAAAFEPLLAEHIGQVISRTTEENRRLRADLDHVLAAVDRLTTVEMMTRERVAALERTVSDLGKTWIGRLYRRWRRRRG